MAQKSSRLRKLSGQKEKHRQLNVVSQEKQAWKKSRRALIVLGLLILGTFAFGAMASWRSLPSVSKTTPMPSPPSMPANVPAKEFVYAGSALLSTVEAFRQPPNDLAVWRPSNGTWYILNSQQQMVAQQWGLGTDLTAPGDFDGDGKTDFSVYRPWQDCGVSSTVPPAQLTFLLSARRKTFRQ